MRYGYGYGYGLGSAQGGVGSLYSAEAEAYFAAMTTQGTDTYKTNINTFIQKLKDDGVWASLDSLHLFANKADSEDAVPASFINMISPADTKAAKIVSPTYEPYKGWKGVAASAINLNQLLTGRTKYGAGTGKTGCAFVYVYTSTAAAYVCEMGTLSAADAALVLDCRIDGDKLRKYINGGQIPDGSALSGSGTGLFSINRINGTQVEVYKDGVLVETLTAAVGSISTSSVYALGINQMGALQSSAINRVVSVCGFGAQMDDTKQAALSAAITAYMGAPK